MTTIPAAGMRTAEIRRWFRYGDPREVSEQLHDLIVLAVRGDPAARLAHLAVARTILEAEGQDALALEAIDLAADEGGHRLAALILTDPPPHAVFSRRAIRNMRLDESMPLGTRKWKATLHDRSVLEKLLGDHEPEVIRRLCLNPKVIEREILGIAARRPTTSETIDAVAHSRWLDVAVIREAIIQNPYSRTGLAISLLPQTSAGFMRTLRNASEIHPALRDAVTELLSHCTWQRRRGGIDARGRTSYEHRDRGAKGANKTREDAVLNSHIFREYDIRGVVGTDLDEGTAESIGKAFG
ncbi:MAG: hypothetical protein KC561_18900, partial [Myxococcales bacterium]|nr:hypothetical protein [Myxococcales bacterium]